MEPLDTNEFGYSEQKLLFLTAVSTSRMWNISRLFLGTSWIRDLFTLAEVASVIKSRIPSLPKNNPYLNCIAVADLHKDPTTFCYCLFK